MRPRFSVSVVLGCALLLAGCGATERSVAVPYSITLDVAPDVNPDLNRKPSPIVLKVFQLKTASAFESADFFSLQDKPQSVLGADLLGVDRIILRPGMRARCTIAATSTRARSASSPNIACSRRTAGG